jgi:signal recognition particle GTPase
MKSTLISILICLAALTGCDKNEPPPAPAPVVKGPTQAERDAKTAAEKVEKDRIAAEKTAKEKELAADKAMEAGVTTRLQKISNMKAGALPTDAQEIAEAIYSAQYLGAVAGRTWYNIMKKDAGTQDYTSNENEQRLRLASGILVWMQQHPAVAEKIIDSMVPALRTKANLIQELRKLHKIIATPYSEKSFEVLLSCSQTTTAPEDCHKEAEKFGVTYSEGRLDSNAAWMTQFLHRRHMNGGDKFARWSQKQLMKLTS